MGEFFVALIFLQNFFRGFITIFDRHLQALVCYSSDFFTIIDGVLITLNDGWVKGWEIFLLLMRECRDRVPIQHLGKS